VRHWLRNTIVLALLAAVALGGWAYAERRALGRQWACYRVGAADSFEAARPQLAWFDAGADRDARLDALVGKWGTGNPRFDLYLARYLAEPECSDRLRERFAARIGSRPELLARWAHYWTWRARLEPGEQVASVVEYHDALFAANSPPPITWREVLDLQAVFELLGQGPRAAGLSPETWPDHYRVWQETRPERSFHFDRPARPFADWEGPLPR
jgi:hypothetical protein